MENEGKGDQGLQSARWIIVAAIEAQMRSGTLLAGRDVLSAATD